VNECEALLAGFTHYDASCYADHPSTADVGFLDEFSEMGKAPYDTLSAARIARVEAAFVAAAGGGGGWDGATTIVGVAAQVLYAPMDGSTAGPYPRSVFGVTRVDVSVKSLTLRTKMITT
jgi:hypothetical protein